MNLETYIENLQAELGRNPEYKDLEVIYAVDDEGNAFHKIYSDPTIAKAEDLNDRYLEIETGDIKPNCIIIN